MYDGREISVESFISEIDSLFNATDCDEALFFNW